MADINWRGILGMLADGLAGRSGSAPGQGPQPLPALGSQPPVSSAQGWPSPSLTPWQPHYPAVLQDIINGMPASPSNAPVPGSSYSPGWVSPAPQQVPFSSGLSNTASNTPAPESQTADHNIAGPNSISPDRSMAWSLDNGKTINILHPDNSLETRTGGLPSWRANSPGNVTQASAAEIGSYGVPIRKADGTIYVQRHAVFDNAQAGMDSLGRQFFAPNSKFLNRGIGDVMQEYASGPGDNVQGYLGHIHQLTGLDSSATLNTLDAKQQQDFLNAIKAHEAWREGSVTWE